MKRFIGVVLVVMVAMMTTQFAAGGEAEAQPPNRLGITHKPICIESDLAQEKAKGLRAGDVFFTNLITSYVLVSGDGCKYNCIMGFDLNCDGKIGDFCPIHLDRAAVNNVKPCLEASVKGTAAATTAAPVMTPVTAPPTTTLAHTGGEDTLAEIGFTLVAAGAAFTALSIRRRRES